MRLPQLAPSVLPCQKHSVSFSPATVWVVGWSFDTAIPPPLWESRRSGAWSIGRLAWPRWLVASLLGACVEFARYFLGWGEVEETMASWWEDYQELESHGVNKKIGAREIRFRFCGDIATSPAHPHHLQQDPDLTNTQHVIRSLCVAACCENNSVARRLQWLLQSRRAEAPNARAGTYLIHFPGGPREAHWML